MFYISVEGGEGEPMVIDLMAFKVNNHIECLRPDDLVFHHNFRHAPTHISIPLFATNRVYHVMSSKWNLDLCSLKIDIASTEMLCVQEGVFSLSYVIQHNSRQQASSDIDRLDIMRSSSGVVCDKKQSKEFHCYSKHGILLFSDFFSLSFHSSHTL